MPGIWGDGQRGGIFGAKVDPRLAEEMRRRRIEEAFAASEGMQEPSQALYAAKHQRAMDVLGNRPPAEPGFRENLASLGPSIRGGLKAMIDPRTSPFGPAAVARMFFDPAGEAGRQVEAGEQLAKPFTQFGDPNVDPVKQGADLALTVMGGSSVVPAEANSLRMGIKAYHGSPHDFERFKLDPSTIRSGEGSIDEGYGIYAGEAKGVGEAYRDANTTIHLSRLARAAQPIHTQQAESIIAHVMDIVEKDGWRALDEYEPPKGFEKAWGAVVDEFKKNKGRFGRLYKVDIDASPEEFIDLDKTLGEQPANVKDAFHRVARDPQFAINVSDDQKMTQFMPHLRKPEVMAALRDKGVKGTRYFDSGSALYGFGKVESPTRNYVVNDANLISILRKYGLPFTAAGLAALSQLHPEEAQAAQQKGKR